MSLFSITDINGIFGKGISSGIKSSGKKDLSYIYIPEATGSACVLTTNQFVGHNIHHNREILKEKNIIKAILTHSGNANVATGQLGKKHLELIVEETAKSLGLKKEEVAIGSTGIIGKHLDIEKILPNIKKLLSTPLNYKDSPSIEEAILTTDTTKKQASRQKNINGSLIKVAGIAKGSGMIAPKMATMLSYVFVNVSLGNKELQTMLKSATNKSFNCISVDTDTSTSDMVVAISTNELKLSEKYLAMVENLITDVCIDLAKQIIKDGEGATKIIEVHVDGASSDKIAKIIAKSIIDSPLVKTAIYGEDPNWGRIVMAIGKVENCDNLDKMSILCGNQLIFKENEPSSSYDRQSLSKYMTQEHICLTIHLNQGTHQSTVWGCDLSERYVHINTKYS